MEKDLAMFLILFVSKLKTSHQLQYQLKNYFTVKKSELQYYYDKFSVVHACACFDKHTYFFHRLSLVLGHNL